MLLLLVFARADQFHTNDLNDCGNCINSGGTQCASYDFQANQCCRHSEADKQRDCMNDYEYCSANVTKTEIIRVMNCPNQGCNEFKHVVIQEYDKEVAEEKVWGWFIATAYGCKIVIEASDELNGILYVDIWSRERTNTDIFQTPKYFSKDHGNHGFYNNEDDFYESGTGGNVFWVPTDWKIIIDYTMTMAAGNVKIKAYVKRYADTDVKEVPKPISRTYVGDTPPGLDNEAERAYQEKMGLIEAVDNAKDTGA